MNKDYYINDVLTHVLLPEVNGLKPNGDWIFQQDGAAAHIVNATQSWLECHFPGFIAKHQWPASSPDLNHLTIASGND